MKTSKRQTETRKITVHIPACCTDAREKNLFKAVVT